MSTSRPASILRKLIYVLGSVALLGLVAALIIPSLSSPSRPAPRFVDGTNLRTIGQARIGYDVDHPDGMPSAAVADVYAFAAELARSHGLTDPQLWFSALDPAAEAADYRAIMTIIDPKTKRINPKFQDAPLAFAVALMPKVVSADIPATTPIAWTRGLQPDGTWRKDSPYGDYGGHVVFNAGNMVLFMGGIDGKLVKFGTQEPTSNIHEALPPGTRIGEYVPPPPR